jgi:hypothetical protein
VNLLITFQHKPHRKHSFHCYIPTIPWPLHRNRCLFTHLLHSNGYRLHSHRLAMGLYSTIYKIILCADVSASGRVILYLESSSIPVNRVFTCHCCFLKEALKFVCHFVDLQWIHAGVIESNILVSRVFCLLRVSPLVISTTMQATYLEEVFICIAIHLQISFNCIYYRILKIITLTQKGKNPTSSSNWYTLTQQIVQYFLLFWD